MLAQLPGIEVGKDIRQVTHLLHAMHHEPETRHVRDIIEPEPATHLTTIVRIPKKVNNGAIRGFIRFICLSANNSPYFGLFKS